MPYRGINEQWTGYSYWECPAQCGENIDLASPTGWDSISYEQKKMLFESIDNHLLGCESYKRMTGLV